MHPRGAVKLFGSENTFYYKQLSLQANLIPEGI
jgi:hypothetical protein